MGIRSAKELEVYQLANELVFEKLGPRGGIPHIL
jgi:hypothetical protein